MSCIIQPGWQRPNVFLWHAQSVGLTWLPLNDPGSDLLPRQSFWHKHNQPAAFIPTDAVTTERQALAVQYNFLSNFKTNRPFPCLSVLLNTNSSG